MSLSARAIEDIGRSGPLPANDTSPATGVREHVSQKVIQLVIAEFFAVAVIAFGVSAAYHMIVLQRWAPSEFYVLSALLIATVQNFVSLSLRHYVGIERQHRHRLLWNGAIAVILTFSIFLSILFLLKMSEEYSRATFFLQALAVVTLILIVRSLFYSRVQSAISAGLIAARRVVLLGDTQNFEAVASHLKDYQIHVVGCFSLPKEKLNRANGVDPMRAAINACRSLAPDDVLILANSEDLPRMNGIVDELSVMPASLYVLPVAAKFLVNASNSGGLGRLVSFQLLGPTLSPTDKIVKRLFDIVVSLTGLVLLSPLFLLVAIAIKLDSRGPALFRQLRHGYNNEAIRVLKFRSMTATTEGAEFNQAVKHDPRFTRVGRILRRSNIDELPQLWNVFTGEMSIVGPRPHAIEHNQIFENRIAPFSRRHNVKPGITGWAQVSGFRGETDTLQKMQARVDHDLYYIDHWSFFFDIKIILLTLFSKRAYVNAY